MKGGRNKMKKKVYAALAVVATLGVGSLTWNYLPTEAKEASVGLFQPAKEDNGKSAEADSKSAPEGQKEAKVVSEDQGGDKEATQTSRTKKSARVVEDNSPQEETDKAQAKSASSKQALADQADAPQASQAETTTKEPASKTPVTITDPVQARQIIIDVMGLDAHALDGYTDEQILESVAAAEELGSDPGYSYRYLQEHFGK